MFIKSIVKEKNKKKIHAFRFYKFILFIYWSKQSHKLSNLNIIYNYVKNKIKIFPIIWI